MHNGSLDQALKVSAIVGYLPSSGLGLERRQGGMRCRVPPDRSERNSSERLKLFCVQKRSPVQLLE